MCVQWKTPDDKQRNCPKHIEFHFENKFEKFVNLDGFNIQIFHYARSHEGQIILVYLYDCKLHTSKVCLMTSGRICLCFVTFRCAVLCSGSIAGILIKYGDWELWYECLTALQLPGVCVYLFLVLMCLAVHRNTLCKRPNFLFRYKTFLNFPYDTKSVLLTFL
jgi:hypothetical protein